MITVENMPHELKVCDIKDISDNYRNLLNDFVLKISKISNSKYVTVNVFILYLLFKYYHILDDKNFNTFFDNIIDLAIIKMNIKTENGSQTTEIEELKKNKANIKIFFDDFIKSNYFQLHDFYNYILTNNKFLIEYNNIFPDIINKNTYERIKSSSSIRVDSRFDRNYGPYPRSGFKSEEINIPDINNTYHSTSFYDRTNKFNKEYTYWDYKLLELN